jgi:hypothetical protein
VWGAGGVLSECPPTLMFLEPKFPDNFLQQTP